MMIKLTSEADKVCVAKANEAGQGHIFDGWDDLGPDAQRDLIAQVQRIDFQLLQRLVKEHLHPEGEAPAGSRLLQGVQVDRLPRPDADREEFELSRTLGEYALRNREVLLVTAAGGGCLAPLSEPVGLLPVGPVTGKSVFQLHAERILAINRRYRTSLRWTVVCHPAEREKVAAFFKAHGYFGLNSADVCLSDQDLLPLVDRRGKIILSGPGRLAMNPGGHGGVILRLLEEGRLEALESAGIRHIFYFQVDNPLAPIADRVFLGHHIKNQCEVSSKAVRRAHPDERVGVFCRVQGEANGAVEVVEHTELSPEDRQATLPGGELALWAANTGVHIFSIEFLRRMRDEGIPLPFHAVECATPYLNRRGAVVRPTRPNGLRFVTFAFDAIRCARRVSIVEADRESEFSPIKQATGGDASLESARLHLSRLHRRWLLEAAPQAFSEAGKDGNELLVEISPLYALDAEELREKLAEGGEVPLPVNGCILLGGRT